MSSVVITVQDCCEIRTVKCTVYLTDADHNINDYNYRDEVFRCRDAYVVVWHGQWTNARAGVGTGVLHREGSGRPFRWLGRVAKFEVLGLGLPCDKQRSCVSTDYLMVIPFDPNTDPVSESKGVHYKRAAQEEMEFSVSADFLSRILLHQ